MIQRETAAMREKGAVQAFVLCFVMVYCEPQALVEHSYRTYRKEG